MSVHRSFPTDSNSIELLYAVAVLERLGGSDAEMDLLREFFVKGDAKLNGLTLEVCQAVRTAAGRWGEDGLLTPEARAELSEVRDEIMKAMDAVGLQIQPLPWPNPGAIELER